ncbi:MAG: hypothetical protein QM504_03460 [Pseudomonadota bacterium]
MKIINPQIILKKNGYAYVGTYIAKKTVGIFIKYRNSPLVIEEYKAIGGQEVTTQDIQDSIIQLEQELKHIDIPNYAFGDLQSPIKYNVFAHEVKKVTYKQGLLYTPSIQISTKLYTIIWSWKVWRKGDFEESISAKPDTIKIINPEEKTILPSSDEYLPATQQLNKLFLPQTPINIITEVVLNAGCNIFRKLSLRTDSN